MAWATVVVLPHDEPWNFMQLLVVATVSYAKYVHTDPGAWAPGTPHEPRVNVLNCRTGHLSSEAVVYLISYGSVGGATKRMKTRALDGTR